MKKNIIALAIASVVAAPIAMADAPTVYGKLNVNVNSTTDQGASNNDTASRIGLKGSEDLGNGLKAVYKVEFDLDLQESGALKGRNQYLGLAGGFGTVLIGSHDTPLKMSQPSDLFNDGAADAKPYASYLGRSKDGGETRPDHVIAYVSPSFSGVKLIAAGVTNAANAKDNSVANSTSFAVTYGSTKKGLYLAAAQNNFSKDVTTTKAYTETRFSAQYKTGGLTVNGMMTTFDDGASTDAASEGTNMQFNAGYKIGKFMPKVKFSTVDYADSSRKDGSAVALGLNYSLGKKTTAYVYTTTLDKNMNTKDVAQVAKATTSTVIGMVHKF
jgi:predicted porin